VSDQHDSDSIYRIIIGIVIVLTLFWVGRVIPAIFQEESLSGGEQLLIGGMIILSLIGVIYVFIQKQNREQNENFRREKW